MTHWSPITGGTQNRLFRLDTLGGAALLAKFYHQDRWDRLHREFSALALLGRHGLARVPRAYIRSDDFSYGVYSFELMGGCPEVIDTRPLITELAADARRGRAAALIGRRFHSTLVEIIARVCTRLADSSIRSIALSGKKRSVI